jgi:RND family efflux transporter MFP subunit
VISHGGEARPDAWAAFTQARSVGEFCQSWLAILVESVGQVHRGLVLLQAEDGSYGPAGFWPDVRTDLTDLADPAKRALAAREAVIEPADDGRRLVLAYPVELRGTLVAAVVLDLAPRNDAPLQQAFRALHWGVGWLDAMLRGQEVERLGAERERAQQVVDALLRVGEAADLDEAAHRAVDLLSERLGLERVSLGLLQPGRSGRLRLQSMSSTAWFDRRSALVRRIENAMEEAWDQRASQAVPPVPGWPVGVAVAHADLAGEGPSASAVLSALVTVRGEAIGVVTVERGIARPFDASDAGWVEAWARSLGPALALHREADRWIAGRLRRKTVAVREALVDPRRPAWRIGLVAGVLLVGALLFVEADHRVTATAALEGVVQRAQVAPFDGYVREARVKAGQSVKTGDVLAVLDDRDLKLEQERWRSAAQQHERRYRDALSRHERAAARIAAAERAEAEAQLALAEEKLARTEVTAPFDGVVVSGDLSQRLGSPVEKGETLFEVAPLDGFRVVLKVDDVDIRNVQVGQRGRLVLAGLPGEPIGFAVRNIAAAGPHEGRNAFDVEAVLDRSGPTLRPGMEGVGKIDAGQRNLLWIWTHHGLDWLRLKWWQWTP